MGKIRQILNKSFIALLLSITILTSMAAQNYASAQGISNNSFTEKPDITIEYYTRLWKEEPNVKILESTDTSLIFEYNGTRTEYYEVRNDYKLQEILIIENGIENIITKNLTNGNMYIDDEEITVTEIVTSELLEDSKEMIPFAIWESPQGVKKYEITWQKPIADLSTSALAAIIVGNIVTLGVGIAAFFASALIQAAFRLGGGYLNAKGTWIKYYTQMYSDWTKYREVWECYWDPLYQQLESKHMTERY